MTAAQKSAKEKFKKAIAYRQKTGCTLKEAFASVYGKKTATKKTAVKKTKVTGVKKSTLANLLKEKKVNDTINKKFKYWEYPVPPVYTGNWTITTWTNWIKKHGRKTKSSVGDFNKNKALFVEAKTPIKPRKKRKKSANVWSVSRLKNGRFKKRGIKNLERESYTEKISGIKKYDWQQLDNIELTRINNDINGNPRYVVHFLNFLNKEEQSFLPFSKKYDYALKKAKLIGGRKFHNKQYGGGVVFQSYNTDNLKEQIIDIMESIPKIKY